MFQNWQDLDCFHAPWDHIVCCRLITDPLFGQYFKNFNSQIRWYTQGFIQKKTARTDLLDFDIINPILLCIKNFQKQSMYFYQLISFMFSR